MVADPRERTYIRLDIMLVLSEHGELSQTRLMNYCGLNMKKHLGILADMEEKGLIATSRQPRGSGVLTTFRVTPKGMAFCSSVLEPYEAMFPRKSAK